jgi:hypothetical protein
MDTIFRDVNEVPFRTASVVNCLKKLFYIIDLQHGCSRISAKLL